MYVTSYGGFVLLSIDNESILIVDPHSLSPPVVEGGMQLELLAAEELKASVTDFKSQNSLPEKPLVSVQGRLQNCSKFWVDEVKAPQFIIDVINTGYRLPFLAFPPAVCARNHKSALEHATFVSEAIQELIDAGCAVCVPTCPTVCSPLQVVVNAKGKLCLVINLRYVNQYLQLSKFKYEILNLIPVLFSEGDYMFTFDLKSGYHHVDIHEASQSYLGFTWGEGCDKKFYVFRVFPFVWHLPVIFSLNCFGC